MSHSQKVPLLELTQQYAPLRDEILAAITRVCDSQRFVLGAEVAAFESEVADYSDTQYAVGVSSGTDALLLALMALEISRGDEVITTPFTFFATAGVVSRLGARPVFCDIDPSTFNLSPTAVAQFIERQCDFSNGVLTNRNTGGRVRVIMPVHLYGQCADMAAFGDIAAEYGLQLVEDAAQAIGAESPSGQRAGSMGSIGCFSFFPTKNLGAFGDAGMCVTSDRQLADRMRVLRVHGGEPKYFHSLIGGNFRLDELQAAILRIKLRSLDDWTAGRQRNAAQYKQLMNGRSPALVLPNVGERGRHIVNQYVVRSSQRDALHTHLTDHGVGCEIYYPLSLHQQACFQYLDYSDADFPEASRAALEVLALPIFAELSSTQIEWVASCVNAFTDSL